MVERKDLLASRGQRIQRLANAAHLYSILLEGVENGTIATPEDILEQTEQFREVCTLGKDFELEHVHIRAFGEIISDRTELKVKTEQLIGKALGLDDNLQ